jgi:hypothetical protein
LQVGLPDAACSCSSIPCSDAPQSLLKGPALSRSLSSLRTPV